MGWTSRRPSGLSVEANDGYVIWAMENCDFGPEDIKRVVRELHWVFDMKSIEEADEHYCQSPY